jgi:S-adenosylmethionine decarboxylase
MHHPTVGRHVLVELFDCDASVADDPAAVRAALHAGAQALGTPVLGEAFHRFSPQGVSGVALIAESHLSCHTWPEVGYVAVDVYTCGDAHPVAAIEAMCAAFGARRWLVADVVRGLVDLAPDAAGLQEQVLLDPAAFHRALGPGPGSRRHVLRACGLVDVTGVVDPDLFERVRAEAMALLARPGPDERPADGPVIRAAYLDPVQRALLEVIAGEQLHDGPPAEMLAIIRRGSGSGDDRDRDGCDGWRLGELSYALLWVLAAPPCAEGGLLQCAPHARRGEPVFEHLARQPAASYPLVAGHAYLLRTDTTLHRLAPLVGGAAQVIVRMAYAANRDLE